MKPRHLLPGLVLAFSSSAPAVDYADPVLFHLSFDTPAISHEWPRADFAKGRANWINRPGSSIALDPEGRFGQGVRWVPPRTVLGYDAAHNIRSEQGALAFWLKLGGNADTEESHLVIIYGRPQPLYFGHPFLRIDHDKQNLLLDFNGARRELIRNLVKYPFDPKGRWVHWAVCWNARTGYYELFLDGESLVHNPIDEPWLPERILDQIGIGNRVGPHQVWGLSPLEKSFDEFWVFNRPLTREEIHQLRDENRPPVDHAPSLPPTTEELLRFRRLEVGLDKPRTLPILHTGLPGNRVTFPYIRSARSVRADIHKVMDGKNLEFWPLFSGWTYSNGKTLLNLELDPHDGFNWVNIKGSLAGMLFDGTPHAREVHLQHPRVQHWMENHWIPLDTTHNLETVTARRRDGRIDEIQFVRIERRPRLLGAGYLTRTFRPTVSPLTETAVRYEPWDHSTASLDIVSRSDLSRLPDDGLLLPAGRFLHLQAGTRGMIDGPHVGQTQFTFHFKSLPPNTSLHLECIDPVYRIRRICTLEARIAPTVEAEPRLYIDIDHRDLRIPDHEKIWWIACFDHDVEISLKRSRLRPMFADVASSEFVTDQVGAIKDLYNLLATGDPTQGGGDPRSTHRAADELITMAEAVHDADPNNEMAKAVLRRTGKYISTWTPEAQARHVKLPPVDDTLADDGSPRWARAGCAALKELRKHPDWWIDERQAANGEFGASANDDCDLVGDWTGMALIGDPGNKIRTSMLKLADYVWEETLEDGVNRKLTDLTHAYEEGTTMLPRSFLLHYGDPVLFERLFGPARFFKDVLTGINAAGHRHVRGDSFSATELTLEEGQAIDIMSFEPGTPALFVAWYNRNPAALGAVREYADSWLAHTQPGEGRFRRSFWGAHPVHFESDEHRPGRFWGLRNGINPQLLFLYEQTGDDTYSAYLAYHWEHGQSPWEMPLNRHDHLNTSWYRLLKGRGVDVSSADNFLLNPGHPVANPGEGDKYARADRPFALRYLVSGDEAHMIEGVMDAYRYMLEEGKMVTEAGLQADRVSIKGQVALSEMFLGGVPDATRYLGYFHHAVSWEGCGDTIARFVTHHDERSLRVRLYSFEDEPHTIGMRVWRLQPGTYRVRTGGDIVHEDLPLERYSRIDLRVPPRREIEVEIKQVRAAEPAGPLPDLAISPFDLRYDKATATLHVPVHNIGSADAGSFTVEISRNGETLTTRAFEGLDAPLDLHPRIIAAVFDEVPANDNVYIEVQTPEPEITKSNNDAVFQTAAPQ